VPVVEADRRLFPWGHMLRPGSDSLAESTETAWPGAEGVLVSAILVAETFRSDDDSG
jgi:hypothetical protein